MLIGLAWNVDMCKQIIFCLFVVFVLSFVLSGLSIVQDLNKIYRHRIRKKAKKAFWNDPLKTCALTKLLKNYCCNLSLLRLLLFSCHKFSVEWKSKLKVIEITEKS